MRILVLLYGVASYVLGVAGLLAIIVTLAGFMPWGFLNPPVSSGVSAVLWNVGLVRM